MAESLPVSAWETEFIPDPDRLFMRVHSKLDPKGELRPNVFRDHPKIQGTMSTDWEKYSDPEQTRLRATSQPNENGVLSMVTGEVRKIPGLLVEHSPQPDNRAHTDVTGKKDPQIRVLRNYSAPLGECKDS